MPGRNLLLEDVRICFRNFSGAPDKFHTNGCRPNFCILLDEGTGLRLAEDGWRVKPLHRRDGDEETNYVLKVNINFDSRIPPNILLISELGKKKLTKDTLAALDYADVKTADVVVTPYQREPGDPFSAYLKTMSVTIFDDPIALKYKDVPDVGQDEEEGDLPF